MCTVQHTDFELYHEYVWFLLVYDHFVFHTNAMWNHQTIQKNNLSIFLIINLLQRFQILIRIHRKTTYYDSSEDGLFWCVETYFSFLKQKFVWIYIELNCSFANDSLKPNNYDSNKSDSSREIISLTKHVFFLSTISMKKYEPSIKKVAWMLKVFEIYQFFLFCSSRYKHSREKVFALLYFDFFFQPIVSREDEDMLLFHTFQH